MQECLKDWFTVDETTPLKQFLNGPLKKKQKTTTLVAKDKNKMRNVRFDPSLYYKLIRPGKVVVQYEGDIPNLADDEANFYIFAHVDEKLHRNQDVPVFEAALLTKQGYYLRVQKCHLRQAYSKCKRTDLNKMYELMPDGTPYWVDRFIFSKESQRQSKRKYENKKKQ